MEPSVSHDRSEETPEAKAQWFGSLSVAERMDVFCSFMDFIVSVNPAVVETAWRLKDAQQTRPGIRILSKP